MTGRTWEIRHVRPGDVVAHDETFSPFDCHHGRYRVGMAAREITEFTEFPEFTAEERAEIERIGNDAIRKAEGDT
jgi:hypothetical protein